MGSDINYDKMRNRRMRLHKVLKIPEKTEPHYSWQWTEAMSGEGGVLPDSLVWKERYDQMVQENLALKKILHDARLSLKREEKEE